MPRQDVVRKLDVLLTCPWCCRQLTEAYVTSLNKAFTPQCKAVARNGHLVALLAGAREGSRELLIKCPESSVGELLPVEGKVGASELAAAAAVQRGVVAPAAAGGAAAAPSRGPGGASRKAGPR